MSDRGFPAADGGCVWLPALVPLPGIGRQVRTPTSQPTPNFCTPAAFSCYENLTKENFGRRERCTGFYADIENFQETANDVQLLRVIGEYQRYKDRFV